MRALLAFVAGLLLARDVVAQEGEAEGGEEVASEVAASEDVSGAAETGASEEIIVFGRREIARRRAELDKDLRKMGYKAKDREGVTVYRPESAWKPSVFVYDDGYVILRRSPPRFESYVEGKSNLRYLACIPPFTLMCIKLGGVLVSERKLTPQKMEVVDAIQPRLKAWQGAISRDVMSTRLGQEIPAMLVATWERGEPTEPGEPALPTLEERRQAILKFWATRADTAEGAAVREVVADFVRLVIQESDTPATPAEIAAAEAQCLCGPLLAEDPARGSPEALPAAP